VTARRALPPREAIERVRALLMEVAATDPEGLLGRGLARFGSWRALAAVLGTDWLPLPRRRAAPLVPLVRRRLRALGAEPAPGLAAELVAAGEPLQLRGTCERLAGLAGDIWRVSVVEDAAGLWAVEEGEDFVLRGAEGDATLVLADGGRLVNASRLRPGDEVAVFGIGGMAPDPAGLAGAYGRGGLVPALRSDPSHPLLVSVIRRYDQEDHDPQD
jgi:hypothetical protein